MKLILGIKGGRPWPPVLGEHLSRMGAELRWVDPMEENWTEELSSAHALALFVPIWGKSSFLAVEQLWAQFLLRKATNCALLLVGYQASQASNYLDLLQLPSYNEDWLDNMQPVALSELPPLQGVDVAEKLKRFFAGHGQDSVVAVLSRLRLIAQMAQREVVQMGTPYEEAYQELLRPSDLPRKWAEWRNRWVNYYPLFRYTPFALVMEQIARKLGSLESWMSGGGREADPLVNGQVLEVLNFVREQLSQIEQDYVLQELSYSHR